MKPTVKLTGRAKQIFDEAMSICKEKEVRIVLADTVFLTAWAQEMGRYFDSAEKLKEAGEVLPFKNGSQEGLQANPYQRTLTTALNNAKKAFASVSKRVQNAVVIEGAEEEEELWYP